MSGNYGGSSLPTTPIGGDVLYSGKNGTYKHWVCTTVVGSAATANFTYDGNVYHVNTSAAGNSSIKMVIWPGKLTAPPTGVWFICYDCSCNSPFTGTTAPSAVNYSGASSDMWKPTIIGSGGQNS
tara:strand:- start:191 stop:565 length:375 start_codon:yes stop_codon:yes gene_type:complete